MYHAKRGEGKQTNSLRETTKCMTTGSLTPLVLLANQMFLFRRRITIYGPIKPKKTKHCVRNTCSFLHTDA